MDDAETKARVALYNAATDYAGTVMKRVGHNYAEVMKLSDALESAAIEFTAIAGDRAPVTSAEASDKHIALQGWVRLLREKIKHEAEVIDAAYSDATDRQEWRRRDRLEGARDTIQNLQGWLDEQQPNVRISQAANK